MYTVVRNQPTNGSLTDSISLCSFIVAIWQWQFGNERVIDSRELVFLFLEKKCSFCFENSQHFHHLFYGGGNYYKTQRDKILQNKLAICVYIIARDIVFTNNGNKVLNSGWNPSIPKSASVCMVIEYFLNEETLCRLQITQPDQSTNSCRQFECNSIHIYWI